MRRIVTGQSAEKSVFLTDGPPPAVLKMTTLPGLEMAALWTAGETPTVPGDNNDPTLVPGSALPAPGQTRFGVIRIPSTREVRRSLPQGFDPAAFREEYLMKAPALAQSYEPEDFGMHTTDTIDYVVVVSGEVWLELDDNQEVCLQAGDFVVQQGTRHAWRNRGDEPCVLAAVMVGAKRSR